MTQRLIWPADLQRQEDGSILVSFPDIPEALTEGATEAEALVEAQDCVIAVPLAGMWKVGTPFPHRPRYADGRQSRCRCWLPPRLRSTARCTSKASAIPR